MVAETVAGLGRLDIAVNNAGVNKNNAAEDTPEHEWDLTFNVNTKGLFLCCQARARGTAPLAAKPDLKGLPKSSGSRRHVLRVAGAVACSASVMREELSRWQHRGEGHNGNVAVRCPVLVAAGTHSPPLGHVLIDGIAAAAPTPSSSCDAARPGARRRRGGTCWRQGPGASSTPPAWPPCWCRTRRSRRARAVLSGGAGVRCGKERASAGAACVCCQWRAPASQHKPAGIRADSHTLLRARGHAVR